MKESAIVGSGYTPFGPVEQWQVARQRRHALERVIQSLEAVEHLRRGLEATLLLKGTPRQIAEKAGDWPRLEHHTRAEPSRDLLRRLERLDREVHAQAERVLAFAHGEQELLTVFGAVDEAGRAEIEQVLELLGCFRREAETAVALRLLLRERSVAVQPLRLQLPSAELRERVARLSARERQCRRRVYEHVQALRQDLERLLFNEALSTASRHSVAVACHGLEEDLEHLQHGGAIGDLPVPLAAVQLDEAPRPPRAAAVAPGEPAARRPWSERVRAWWRRRRGSRRGGR